MKTVLTHTTNYHVWANNTIIGFIENISGDQLTATVVSSFATIKATVVHLANAEYNWLQRVQGNSVWETKITEENTLTEITDFWKQQSQQWCDVVAAHDITGLMQPIDHQNLSGQHHSLDLYKIIMHVCNHATYHRGQLVTMLRQVGYTQLSSLDMSTFFRL